MRKVLVNFLAASALCVAFSETGAQEPGGAAFACEWTNDGECDEPVIGTGICPGATDTADCSVEQGRFGILAISDTTLAWAFVDQKGNRLRLQAQALNQCGQPDCQLLLTVQTSCVALATTTDYYGWGVAGNAAEAEDLALDECKGPCRIVLSSCGPEYLR